MKTALIDLSAIFRKFWHVSEGEPVTSSATKTVNLINDVKHQFDSVKVCVDCPPYKRKEVYPEYKANRPPMPIGITEELNKCKKLLLDGKTTLLTCEGAEADDIIGTYCQKAQDEEITIYGFDKDLLQIPSFAATMFDPFARKQKTAQDFLGIDFEKVIDYLALVGDKSDNIPGVPGVGDVTAKALVNDFGTVENIIEACEETPNKFTKKKILASILENKEQLRLSKKLVTLDYECEIVENVADSSEEQPQESAIEASFEENDNEPVGEPTPVQAKIQTVDNMKIVKHDSSIHRVALEPTRVESAWKLALTIHDSQMFIKKFPTPNAILAVIMRGRSLGIDSMTALENLNVIQQKTCMSSALMVGLVMNDKRCEYLECIETTMEKSVWITKRAGYKHERKMEYTIEEAKRAGLFKQGGNWEKMPKIMCRWAGGRETCRAFYPDIVAGIYSPEEIENFD